LSESAPAAVAQHESKLNVETQWYAAMAASMPIPAKEAKPVRRIFSRPGPGSVVPANRPRKAPIYWDSSIWLTFGLPPVLESLIP